MLQKTSLSMKHFAALVPSRDVMMIPAGVFCTAKVLPWEFWLLLTNLFNHASLEVFLSWTQKMFIQTLKSKIFGLFIKSVNKSQFPEPNLINGARDLENVDWLDLFGYFPERLTSGPARTLEALLRGKRVNCFGNFNGAKCSRLRDCIATLRSTHGWNFIESEYKTVQTKNGRKQRVKEFWLSPLVIESASALGALDWCKSVRSACREQKSCSNRLQRLKSVAV